MVSMRVIFGGVLSHISFLNFGGVFNKTTILFVLGSITSRCSGKEPALLSRTLGEDKPDTRERRKSSLHSCMLDMR